MTTSSAEVGKPGSAPAWYACYTRARHEKKVDARLTERGFETYLPLIPRKRQWHDREKIVEWPLFPSYIFVRCRLERMADILVTPGISTVVRFNGSPAVVPAEQIENVRRFTRALLEQETSECEPEPLVYRGQHVRVTSGPFEDVEGVVLEERGERTAIGIGVEVVGQGIRLEVETRVLEVLEGED